MAATISLGPKCPRCNRLDGTAPHCPSGCCPWVYCPHCSAMPSAGPALVDRRGYRQGDFYPNGRPNPPRITP